MFELQRREMMEAMGVKILLPRFQLPAAKNSPRLIEQDLQSVGNSIAASAPESAVSVETANVVNATNVANTAVLVEGDTEAANAVVSKSLPANIAQELSSLIDIKTTLQSSLHSKEKPLKFRYRLVRVGELLMLLDQPAIEWQESTEAKQFFSDIYWALTAKKPEFYSESQFDWPPSKQFPFAHDKEMARQTLHSFMQEQMQQPACSWVLVWGAPLAENLFESMPKVGEVGFINETSVLLLDSMQYYWQNPVSKHLLWQSLQTVKKSLLAKPLNA